MIERESDEGFLKNWDEGLRQIIRYRTQACAESRAQDECLCDFVHDKKKSDTPRLGGMCNKPSPINSIARNFQRIGHTQFVHNKLVDLKVLDFRSTNDEASDGDGAHGKGSNCQRTKRESSHALRSDCQYAHAHWREIIWFWLAHAAVACPQA